MWVSAKEGEGGGDVCVRCVVVGWGEMNNITNENLVHSCTHYLASIQHGKF